MTSWAFGCCTVCKLPDNLEDAIEVRLDLADSLRQQPTVCSNTHIGHPVDRHQSFYQPAQWVEGGVTGLEEVQKNYREIFSLLAKRILRNSHLMNTQEKQICNTCFQAKGKLKDLRPFLWTQKVCFSKFLLTYVSRFFYFDKKIHLTGVARSWFKCSLVDWPCGLFVYLDKVEADGVISLHGDWSSMLWDDLQTLQGSAMTSRQHLWTWSHAKHEH